LKLPAISVSRWAINDQGDAYRVDGYVGIGTDSPTEKLHVDGNIISNDPALPEHVSTKSYVDEQIASVQVDIDGYARATDETLSFTVDYNLAGAIEALPFGTVFSSQAQIDGYLADAGTTAFKYFQDAWNSLPTNVVHNVTFNLAAGVHRPRSPESNTAAWTLSGKTTIAPAIITIQGASSASYVTVVPSSTITAVQAASNDPFVDVDYPFAVDGYRGLFAIFDTGQVVVIHDNSASRLSVATNISPSSPTSVIVGRPGTILRNSYDDFNRVKTTGISVGSGNLSPCRVTFSDIQFDGFNPTFSVTTGLGAIVAVTRFLIDHAYVKDTFGVSDSGRGFQPGESFTATVSSLRGTNIAAVPTTSSGDALFCAAGGKTILFSQCYIGGFRRILMAGPSNTPPGLSISSVVFDKMWQFGLFLQNGIPIFAQHNSSGVYSTFRDIGGTAIYLQRNCHFSPGTTQTIDIKFEGQGAFPCLLLEQGSSCIIEAGIGLQNGATSNADVGIQLSGPHNRLILNSSTNVSGTNGEVRFSDNSVRFYADIKDAGPFIDTSLNFAQKA